MEKEVRIDPLSITFDIHENNRLLRIPKSQTKIQYIEQFNLITQASEMFVPLAVAEEEDAYLFTFFMKREWKTWDHLKGLEENEKLRALWNLEKLLDLMSTRITFFLHPNNLVFDHNLMPKIILRGIRGLSKPYDIDEEDILKQYKSLIVAMFSNEYKFDDLYKGSLEKAAESKFEKLVMKQTTLHDLLQVLKKQYQYSQAKTENEKSLVSTKRFKLYKHLSIWISVLTIIFLSLLMYTAFVKVPYQERLLQASNKFLADDYDEVIHILHDDNPDDLPQASKYILAASYLNVEQLSDSEKESIRKNIHFNSDKRYLLYWIYNGLGEFDRSIDIAKYVDDPTLIMYGLIKKVEQVKNDPELSGDDRDEQVRKLRDELEKYVDEYDVEIGTEEEDSDYMEYPSDKEASDKEKDENNNEESGKTPKSVIDKDKKKEKD